MRVVLNGDAIIHRLTPQSIASCFKAFGSTSRSEMNEGAYLYIVRCSDGSLYIGTTRTTLETRIAQHNDGTFKGYTETRRPVVLVYAEWFDRITDAIENERKLKKWTRAKKEAFIRGDFASLRALARRKTLFSKRPPPSS
jgi:putative endonuclease